MTLFSFAVKCASSRAAWIVLFCVFMSGCGVNVQPYAAASPIAGRSLIGRTCAALNPDTSNAVPVALFVEVARVASPVEKPLRASLAFPVEVSEIAGLLIEDSKVSKVPWGHCAGASCMAEQGDSLTLHMLQSPADAAAPVELELGFVGQHQRTTVSAMNQEPVLAEVAFLDESDAIVVTPYYLFGTKGNGLRSLYECFAARKGTGTGAAERQGR